jgi:cell wall-associated NlpC family hydrolase
MKKILGLLSLALLPWLVSAQCDTIRGNAYHPAVTSFTRYCDSLENAIVDYSTSFLKTPYHYGGNSKKGIDCSGFVLGVYHKFGVKLPHSSRGMAESGRTVGLEEVRRGDLLFFRNTNHRRKGIGHVAIVTDVRDGNVTFIHSARIGGVRYDNLSAPYYQKHYFKAIRLSILDSVPGKQ